VDYIQRAEIKTPNDENNIVTSSENEDLNGANGN
jgi:hypothetical protein